MARHHQGDTFEDITGHRLEILDLLAAMMVDFKLEVAKLRAEGVTQGDIETMLVELEERYGSGVDVEGELVIRVLREAARLPKQNTRGRGTS